MKQKKWKMKIFLSLMAVMLTLFMASQTFAQSTASFHVETSLFSGLCTYEGQAWIVEYQDALWMTMDLMRTGNSGGFPLCPDWLMKVNNTNFIVALDPGGNPFSPCSVAPDGSVFCNSNLFSYELGVLGAIGPWTPDLGLITAIGQFTDNRKVLNGVFLLGLGDDPPDAIGEFTATRVGDAVLFPWIVKSDDVTTVVSVVNTAQTEAESLGLPFHNNRIHVEYWHKQTTANGQEETCIEANFELTSSKDDMVTWDIGGHFNGGLPMFNDDSNEVIFAPDMTLAVENPRRGFLIVDNGTESLLDARTAHDGTMYGEATIIEHKTGAAWGYIGYNAMGGGPHFYDSADLHGEVVGKTALFTYVTDEGEQFRLFDIGEVTQTTLLNPNDAITKLFVTPTWVNQRNGNLNARVQLCRYPERYEDIDLGDFDISLGTLFGLYHTGECTGGGIWNNEEGGFSFTVKKNVVCTTADNIVDFFGGAGSAAYSQWVASGKAGWAYITPHRGDLNETQGVSKYIAANDIIIGKLEYGTGLNWDGSISDTINNFVWLRDNSIYNLLCNLPYPILDLRCNPGGINIIHNQYYRELDELDLPGACCYATTQAPPTSCEEGVYRSDCESRINGIWLGGLTSCDDDPPTCPPPLLQPF